MNKNSDMDKATAARWTVIAVPIGSRKAFSVQMLGESMTQAVDRFREWFGPDGTFSISPEDDPDSVVRGW